MRSRLAYFMVAFVLVLKRNKILRVNGQPTVQGSEFEDASIGIVAEIQQLFGATCQRQNEQVQQIHELHNVSFQEIRRQLDAVITSLQEVDRRSQEQIRDMKNLNVSFQQIKDQQDSVVTSLEVSNRCPVANDTSNNNQTQTEVAAVLETDLEVLTFPPPTVNNWTILMNRFDGSLNFNRSWVEYRNGFGDIGRGEFWLGNEEIHRLTNTNAVVHTLRIEVQRKENGQWYYADYDTFSIDSESNKYTLHLSGYSGNAGDSLTGFSMSSAGFLGGMNFSTFDNDNDRGVWTSNCAMSFEGGGGWWFNNCQFACLTCSYNSASAFRWSGQLRAAKMMIKSK